MTIQDYNFYQVDVSLKDYPNYTTSFNVLGLTIVATFGYNTRMKKRWVRLETPSGELLLSNTFLNVGHRILPSVNMRLLGYNFYITLNEISSGDMLQWSNNYKLTFVGTYQENKEDYHKEVLDAVVNINAQ